MMMKKSKYLIWLVAESNRSAIPNISVIATFTNFSLSEDKTSLKCMNNSFKPLLYILCNSSECRLMYELNRIYLCTVYTQTESCGRYP